MHVIAFSQLWLTTSVQGWGFLKLRSLISPLGKFSILQTNIVRLFQSRPFFKGINAAELRRYLSNMNVIFISNQCFDNWDNDDNGEKSGK